LPERARATAGLTIRSERGDPAALVRRIVPSDPNPHLLRLTPDATLRDAPPLDVLHVPGGFGREALMEDEAVLRWICRHAALACSVF
jgi:putative intracellular protease/amidase